jgi:multicomponent K+:H+ antiporter subunit D
MLGAVASTALRQQIAYLVIASVGTLLAAFALDSVDGIAAGLYYLPHTTFATAACFLLADPIARARGEYADRFEPGPTMPGAPLLGGLFFVAAIAMSGLPPLSGFLGKFMLLRAALDSPWLAWLWSVVLVTGLVGVIALARSGSLLFYRTHAAAGPLTAPRAADWLPAAGLLLLGLGLAIGAGPLSQYATATAAQLLNPQDYIDAVLGARP